MITLIPPTGLQFVSDGITYLALQFLNHVEGEGSIWLAVPKSHDLSLGPINAIVVLADGPVVPVD